MVRCCCVLQTRTVCIDLAAAANKPCEGSEWTSLKSIMSELDVGTVFPLYLRQTNASFQY